MTDEIKVEVEGIVSGEAVMTEATRKENEAKKVKEEAACKVEGE